MLVNDPRSDAQIDVTGWDLDFLADLAGGVLLDLALGNVRALSRDEILAIDLGDAAGEVWTDHPQITEHVARWGEIYAEAIYQRDLGHALTQLALGHALVTGSPQWLAYDRYVRELAELPE